VLIVRIRFNGRLTKQSWIAKFSQCATEYQL